MTRDIGISVSSYEAVYKQSFEVSDHSIEMNFNLDSLFSCCSCANRLKFQFPNIWNVNSRPSFVVFNLKHSVGVTVSNTESRERNLRTSIRLQWQVNLKNVGFLCIHLSSVLFL